MTAPDQDFSRGFLPTPDPLIRLPEPFEEWEAVARDLSKLALNTALRPTLERLPPFPLAALRTERECERAMSMVSFMANLYVFAPDRPIASRLPTSLAVAWHGLATRLGRPPMLTYASQTLHNWRRLDPHGPIAVGNLAMIQNFLGGMDEEWFVTLHVHIEAAAGRGLSALSPAQQAVLEQDSQGLTGSLSELAASLRTMQALLRRMPQRCQPDTYYHRVRPYMFGWKNNPDLPHGMYYDGVAAYKDQPQQFRGETGAQSSVMYAFDAALGIHSTTGTPCGPTCWNCVTTCRSETAPVLPALNAVRPFGTMSTGTDSARPHCARRITGASRPWPSFANSTSTMPPDTSSSRAGPRKRPRSEPAVPLLPSRCKSTTSGPWPIWCDYSDAGTALIRVHPACPIPQSSQEKPMAVVSPDIMEVLDRLDRIKNRTARLRGSKFQ